MLQESSLQSYLEKLPVQTKLKYYHIIYTDQNYKSNTIVFAPIFHELNSKIEDFFSVHKRPISLKYCSQICLNLC